MILWYTLVTRNGENMKLKNLMRKSGMRYGKPFGDGSSMTMSEYEELVEEHEYKVQNGMPVDGLPNPSTIYVDLQYLRKRQFAALDEEIKTTGLHFDLKRYESFLFDLFTFMKENYDRTILLCDELVKIRKEEHLSYLHYAVFGSCSSLLGSYNGNILRKRYENFFEFLNSKSDYSFDFWNNLDRYLVIMLSIFDKLNGYSVEERNSFFDKVINNFQKIKELGVDDLYISSSKEKVDISLGGQPEGMEEGSNFGRLDYEEENFYTDGAFTDTYNEGKQMVDVNIQEPKFVLKCGRRVGYGLLEYFDHNWSSITIYDLCFDSSKMPCKEDLENTKSDLDSYNYMFNVKKLSVLKKKLKKIKKLLFDLYLNLDTVIELSEEIDVFDLLKNKIGLNDGMFSDEDIVMLEASQIDQTDEIFDEMGKQLIRKR